MHRFRRWLAGRNGFDQLSRFCILIACILLVVNFLFSSPRISSVLWFLSILLVAYVYFRAFSRDVYKRQAENTRFLQLRWKIQNRLSGMRDMWRQRREYCFFRCPACHAVLRVPKGKGRVRIVCRKCGNAFERKT